MEENGNGVHEVAQKRANGFGLFDMLGNVWEWVNDWYDETYYQNSPMQDPHRAHEAGRCGDCVAAPGAIDPRTFAYRAATRDLPGYKSTNVGVRCGGEAASLDPFPSLARHTVTLCPQFSSSPVRRHPNSEEVEGVCHAMSRPYSVSGLVSPSGTSWSLRNDLVSASSNAEAQRTSEENPDYNIIPIQDEGVLVAFYERDTNSSRSITVQDLVGSDTSVMDLAEILSIREFCFALVGNEIGGYVHFSDLNNPLVKLTFYVIFEAFERHLLAAISPVTEQEIQRTLGLHRLDRIRREVQRAQADDANLSLEHFLYLPEILRIAVAKHKLSLDEERVQIITKFRNRDSHAGSSLIRKHEDVNTLIAAKNICLAFLNGAPTSMLT